MNAIEMVLVRALTDREFLDRLKARRVDLQAEFSLGKMEQESLDALLGGAEGALLDHVVGASAEALARLLPQAPAWSPGSEGPGRVAPKLERVAAKLERTAPKLERTAPKLERTAPKLERVAPKLERTAPKLERVVPKLDRVAPKIDRVAPKLERVAPKLDRVEAKLERLGKSAGRKASD